MNPGELFDKGPAEQAKSSALPPLIGGKRLRRVVRDQVEFRECALDELLPEEHQARVVWAYVAGLDLCELYACIQAVETGPG